MALIAVAALSARMLAQAAREDGFRVIGLDLFGDADTRAACVEWRPIGASATLRIDPAGLLDALAALARRGDVTGWVAGSGFEAQPEVLEQGAALLPLIGNRADGVRRVRDPAQFFGRLDGLGIAHPAVNLRAPGADSGWLMKDAHACGGWHIRRATSADRADGPSRYFQREANGTPMSATFIASANGVDRLGFNRQIVRRFGDRPFVFCGVIGPVELPGAVARRVDEVLHPLAAAFALRGLGSLDFLLDGDSVKVLEINPRPPASLALYGPGVFAAHCRACAGQPVSMPAPANRSVRGIETVFAPRRVDLDPATARAIAALPDCHDWPAAARFEAGDPVCSVAASADTAAAVENLLTQHSLSVHRLLDPLP